MAVVHVVNGRQKKLFDGHPWIYRNEIERIEGEYVPGDAAEAVDYRGRLIGHGFINPASMITMRLLTHGSEPVTDGLIADRVRAAVSYRRYFRRDDTDCERLIFGEADLLPGVIADRFGDVVVMQTLALGMARYEDLIARTLADAVHPKTILLRNDEPIREKECMELVRRVYSGEDVHKTILLENGIRMEVDLLEGQKTGYFLDQKANHRRIAPFAEGRSVLDCFTYVGAFALHAARAGAKEVLAADISEAAVAAARRNAALNGLDQVGFVTANAFDLLREFVREKRLFDVIVLDPPAFAKSRSALAGALRGYKEINLSAMRLLPPGGILATHSCSFHVPEETFVSTVLSAANDLRRQVRIIGLYGQDHDHPILGGYPESRYLKSLWLEMME